MNIKFILLTIAAVLNIVIGLLIIKKNYKHPGNVYYGLTCLTGGLWVMSMGLLHSLQDLAVLNIILNITVIFSVLPPLFYLLFVISFPYHMYFYVKQLWFGLPPLLLIILVATGVFSVENIYLSGGRLIEEVNFTNYLFYAIYFFTYIFIGFYLLIKKYLKSEGIHKIYLQYLIFGTIITFLITTFFSIILPLVNGYFYDWYSPLFTLINFIIIGYLIFIKPKILR